MAVDYDAELLTRALAPRQCETENEMEISRDSRGGCHVLERHKLRDSPQLYQNTSAALNRIRRRGRSRRRACNNPRFGRCQSERVDVAPNASLETISDVGIQVS